MEYLKIGKIVNTRGIRGEMKIKPLTDFQEDRYKIGNTVYILFEGTYIPFVIKKYNSHKNLDFVILKDNEDINLIEKYKGSDIYVDSDSEITLYEDEYHLSELVDIDVFQSNLNIGRVVDVLEYPQGDYLVIEKHNGERKSIPFRDEFILEIDIENKTIKIIDMEGLLWN